MAQQRSIAVTFVAIVNILIGAIGLLGAIGIVLSLLLVSGGGVPGQPPNPGIDMHQYLVREVPSYMTFTVVGGVLLLFAAAVAIASGIGLLRLRPWLRKLCIAYGIYLIVHQVAALVYNLLVVMPVIARWQASFADRYPGLPPALAMSAQVGLYAGICFGFLYVAYGLFLVVLMLQSSTRAAFADLPGGPTRPEDEYDQQLR